MGKALRAAAILLAVGPTLACGPRRPPPAAPSLFPVSPLWTATLADFTLGPLAADESRVIVATRDGSVQALDRTSGALLWRIEGRGGLLGSGPGVIVTRGSDGTVSRLRPRSGEAVWRAQTGVQGSLPPVVDGDMILVAGNGISALEAASGRILWSVPPGAIASTVPVPAGARIVLGETDGTLRCRDRATGVSLWTHRLRSAPLAAPLVAERRVFLGTTDRQLLTLGLDRGHPGWSWKLGTDVQSAPVAFGNTVVFAALDAVLYALRRSNGHLAWRAPLPSRPLAAPLLVGNAILVACAESDIVGFDAKTGARLGALKTRAEIRTGPLVLEGRLYVGLRDRSVAALAFAGFEGPPPASPSPGQP